MAIEAASIQIIARTTDAMTTPTTMNRVIPLCVASTGSVVAMPTDSEAMVPLLTVGDVVDGLGVAMSAPVGVVGIERGGQ